MKILIVDDSRVIRLANQSALNKAGHQTFSAGDGEEGLRLAREHRPDLIVLDMMLPKLSGPEVMRALRQDENTAEIPIMVLTSLPQSNEEKLKADGATEYFQKSNLRLDQGASTFVEAVERIFWKLKPRSAGAPGS
jgi:CheY-like chemotaxis protein